MENNDVETIETPEKETLETPNEGVEPEEKTKEMSGENKSKLASFDRIYAERKEFKEKLEKAEVELRKAQEKEFLSPEEKETQRIIEITSALEGLGDEEKKEVMLRAKANKSSLTEARKDPNFLLWQKAKREKVEEEKSKLEPSTKISPSEKSFEKITPEDLGKMSIKEKEEVLKKKGWIKERR